MHFKARDVIRRCVRAYTLRSPLTKGKGRLIEATRRWTIADEPIESRVGDGYLMRLDLTDLIQRNIYFFGFYEPSFARVLKQVLRSGDTFVVAGDNIGYFSMFDD